MHYYTKTFCVNQLENPSWLRHKLVNTNKHALAHSSASGVALKNNLLLLLLCAGSLDASCLLIYLPFFRDLVSLHGLGTAASLEMQELSAVLI